MDNKYFPQNTNLEKIDPINVVTKYVTSSFGRSSTFSRFNYFSNSEICTLILDKDKVTLFNNNTRSDTLLDNNTSLDNTSFSATSLCDIPSLSDKIFEIPLMSNIPPGSLVSFIFNGVLSRSHLLHLVDSLFLKGCKGLLIQPYSLSLCMGMGLQHCIVINQYDTYSDIYIIDEYVLHDSFTVRNNNILKGGYIEDYVEEYQKVRLTEETVFYGCKVCDYKSKDLGVATEHLKVNHYFDKDTNMIYKYENKHGDLVDELIKRLKFLYFNLDRLKRINIRLICSNSNDNLVEQLKFLYNNVILISEVDENFVYKGNEIFNSLDLSKECWISEKEWRDWGLRVLKDKVLFNI